MSEDRYVEGGSLEDVAGYARAVRIGSHIAVSGTTATFPAGEPPDTYEQTAQALDRGLRAIIRLGGSAETVLRTRVFLAPGADWQTAARAHAERFDAHRPANTMLYVGGMIGPDELVEVELDAEVAE